MVILLIIARVRKSYAPFVDKEVIDTMSVNINKVEAVIAMELIVSCCYLAQ